MTPFAQDETIGIINFGRREKDFQVKGAYRWKLRGLKSRNKKFIINIELGNKMIFILQYMTCSTTKKGNTNY